MKYMKIFLFLLVAGIMTGCSDISIKKPNLVFFLVDDMGWQETSVPFHSELTELNRRYHTPNMELLAESGMKFTQAYACAVCSPTRISLMTGMNAARHMVTNWTLRKNKSPDWKNPVVTSPEWNLNGISPVPGIEKTKYVVTLPMILKDAGYFTIHVGKAHFGAKGTPGEDPLNLGFDVNIAGHAAGGPGSYYGKYNFSAAWRGGDTIWDIPGLEKYHGTDIYLTEALTIEANRMIDSAVSLDKPFYLYMSHYAIHAPWEKDPRYFDKYKAEGLNDFRSSYASMVESMDKSLGDIRQNIARHGIDNETIIIFMSDNGQPSQADRNLPLRGHKLTPYEGGIRVPMIVDWPGVTKPVSSNNNYLIIEDIFPSILEMAGVNDYEQIGGVVDGVSFVSLLNDSRERIQDRPIYWHFPNTYDQPPYSVVRQGDWKLIYWHAGQEMELYNIKDDISEKNDLSTTETERLSEMAGILSDFLREAGALMPTINETGKTVPYPDEK